jgi:hypothetical protein
VPQLALKIDVSAVEGVRYDVQVLSAAEAPLFQVRSKEGESSLSHYIVILS